jgi:hypothetical protein
MDEQEMTKDSHSKYMCGILVSNMPSEEAALKSAKAMKNCPRLVASGVNSNMFFGVYILPNDMKWWLTIPEEKPELLGAITVQAYYTEQLLYPVDFKLRLSDSKSEISPCGTNCTTCPMREEQNCHGCPATVHYSENA